MKTIFLNNYRIKIVSILLATGIWWFIYASHHPTISSPVSVKIQYENLSPDYRLIAPRRTVRVELSGDSQAIEGVTSENLQARVDLSSYGEGRRPAAVNILNYTGAQVIRGSGPIVVNIRRLNKIELPVKLNFSGSLPVGFALGRVTYHPANASIYGEEEELSRIGKLIASIDLTDRTKSFQTKALLKAQDTRGRTVSDTNIRPSAVTVDVPIQSKYTRTVPINPKFKAGSTYQGSEKAGFYPTTITLVGDEDILRGINSVDSEEFDPALCGEGGVIPLQLKLPKNVFVNVSQVTFSCEPPRRVSRSFLVTIHTTHLCEGCKATLEPDEVEVATEGSEETVNAINITDVSAFVDLKGLDPGKHSVEPDVNLNETIRDVKLRYSTGAVKVTISK